MPTTTIQVDGKTLSITIDPVTGEPKAQVVNPNAERIAELKQTVKDLRAQLKYLKAEIEAMEKADAESQEAADNA